MTPGVWRIQRIADETTHHIHALDLRLDPAFLAGINASRRGELRIRIEAAGKALAEKTAEINLVPPSHWGGVNCWQRSYDRLIRPVDVALREASGKLAAVDATMRWTVTARGQKRRAWEIADAIWTALLSHGIACVLRPKSFEGTGQQIRGRGDILSRKVGTCLDLTLLFASWLEQAALNPILAPKATLSAAFGW